MMMNTKLQSFLIRPKLWSESASFEIIQITQNLPKLGKLTTNHYLDQFEVKKKNLMNNCRLPQRSYSSPLNSKSLFAGGRNFCEAASKYYPSTTQKLSFRPHQLSTRYGPGFNQTSTLFFKGRESIPKTSSRWEAVGSSKTKLLAWF